MTSSGARAPTAGHSLPTDCEEPGAIGGLVRRHRARLQQPAPAGRPVDVVLVDNASSDGAAEREALTAMFGAIGVSNGALFWYGLRFTSRNIGVDLGFVRPIGVADSDFVLGLPVVTFSYRGID